MVGKIVRAFLVSWLAAVTAGMAAEAAGPRIIIGPNILVSRDGDVPHVELIVAANPKTREEPGRRRHHGYPPDGGWACRAYASTDGGTTWTASAFAQQVESGAATRTPCSRRRAPQFSPRSRSSKTRTNELEPHSMSTVPRTAA